MIQIFEILPHQLYQSPMPDDWNAVYAIARAVISMEHTLAYDPYRIVHLSWFIPDGDAPPREQLDAVANFGVACIRAGLPVLTHCAAGINRASLVSARIVMLLNGWGGQQSIDWVRAHRTGDCLVNHNFVNLLLSYP